MGEVGAKLCPRRSKLEPSWRQDGPILFLNGRIETILGGILVIFLDSGQDLCRNRRSVKTITPPSLLMFFLRVGAFLEWSWGLSWGVLERYFGIRWLQDDVFGSIFNDVAGSWRQDGEQKRQNDFHCVFFIPSLQKY